jgi:glutamate 5-kinase
MAGDAGSEISRGGMVTKLAAAKIAVSAGTHMVIASGKERHPLRALTEGAPCTWFLASANPVTARKRWIGGTLEPKGVIVIDDGARTALQSGRSLLPAGVKSVSGLFERGDAVIIRDTAGAEIGRGLIAYSAKEAALIAGRNSVEIVAVLGYSGRAALIHRDDMALLRDLG